MHKNNYPLLFVDIETTHLASTTGEIIEIAIIRESHDGKIETFYSKIKPAHIHTASKRALEINHYNAHEWKDAPTWKEIAPVVVKWLNWGTIVAHNVAFDWNYIDHHVRMAKIDHKISWRKIDTQSLAWEHLPMTSASMDNIRDFFGMSKDKAHTAMKDVEDCRFVYHKLIRSNIFMRLYWKLKFQIITIFKK
jgi:DNA polymerase III epsilon subunit-like protein